MIRIEADFFFCSFFVLFRRNVQRWWSIISRASNNDKDSTLESERYSLCGNSEFTDFTFGNIALVEIFKLKMVNYSFCILSVTEADKEISRILRERYVFQIKSGKENMKLSAVSEIEVSHYFYFLRNLLISISTTQGLIEQATARTWEPTQVPNWQSR